MDRTYKSELIGLIKEMGCKIGDNTLSTLFDSSESATGDQKVGCNQFRRIASACRNAECYEEILLFIQYTQSKSKVDRSWKTKCGATGKPFGEIVTDYMDKVRGLCANADWDKARELIRLFFGYLYWQSRIWADQNNNAREQRSDQRNAPYNNGNGQNRGYNGGRNNNQTYGRR